jgi:hypothetical protein
VERRFATLVLGLMHSTRIRGAEGELNNSDVLADIIMKVEHHAGGASGSLGAMYHELHSAHKCSSLQSIVDDRLNDYQLLCVV